MFKSNEHTLNWQESYYSFDALNYSRNEIFSPSPGGTTIGCQRGPSAPRAPSAQTWFCTLRISPRKKAGWDRSCQGGRSLFRPSETSAERKGWASTIFFCPVVFFYRDFFIGECGPADCRVLFHAQQWRHREIETSLQKRFWNVWLYLACRINAKVSWCRNEHANSAILSIFLPL